MREVARPIHNGKYLRSNKYKSIGRKILTEENEGLFSFW